MKPQGSCNVQESTEAAEGAVIPPQDLWSIFFLYRVTTTSYDQWRKQRKSMLECHQRRLASEKHNKGQQRVERLTNAKAWSTVCCVTLILFTNITHSLKWYALSDKWILAQKLRISRHNLQNTWNSRRRKTKVWILRSCLEWGTKYPWKELQRQSVEQRWEERPSRDCPTWGSTPYTTVLYSVTLIDSMELPLH
jgi:hypothetical protein